MGNTKLIIWLNIPSKCIEDLNAIVSVIVGIFLERLIDTSCQDFPFVFWYFSSCG